HHDHQTHDHHDDHVVDDDSAAHHHHHEAHDDDARLRTRSARRGLAGGRRVCHRRGARHLELAAAACLRMQALFPRAGARPDSGVRDAGRRRDQAEEVQAEPRQGTAGDLLAACLAYLLAFVLRTHVPLPLTQGYLPGVRFAEVHHHWPEMLLAQGAVLYFLGLYEAHALTRPRDHVGAMVAAAPLQALVLVAVYF